MRRCKLLNMSLPSRVIFLKLIYETDFNKQFAHHKLTACIIEHTLPKNLGLTKHLRKNKVQSKQGFGKYSTIYSNISLILTINNKHIINLTSTSTISSIKQNEKTSTFQLKSIDSSCKQENLTLIYIHILVLQAYN